MKILAIETSCDDTALSLVECEGSIDNPSFRVLKNIVSSQTATHRPFGGVVPHLAKREHARNLPELAEKIGAYKDEVDALAVTVGPGLAPALWAGVNFAKELAEKLGKPLLGANHLEGHMYSILLPSEKISTEKLLANLKFPSIGLIVSGGNTLLLKLNSLKDWELIGETRDDAVGEAFDKVGKMLGLPFPGGPEIEKLAKEASGEEIDFPRPMLHEKNYDFSFSGLKTAVLYYLKNNAQANKADVADNFQRASTEVLSKKLERAFLEFGGESIFVCGGVAANKFLKKSLEEIAEKEEVPFLSPEEFVYNTDNAAMIAAAAYMAKLRGLEYEIEADANLRI